MRHALAFLSCGLFVAAWCLAFTPRQEPTYTYLAFDAAGEAYALDTGLTYADCVGAAAELPALYEAAICEPEA